MTTLGATWALPAAAPRAGESGWFGSLRTLAPLELLAVATLIVAAGPFMDAIWRTPENRLVLQTLWTVLALIWLAALWQACRLRWLRWASIRLALLLIPLLLAFVSGLWSPEPSTSVLRAAAVLATTVVGIALGYPFSPRALMRAFFWAYAVTLIVWALYVLAIMFGFWPGMVARGETTALQPLPMLVITLVILALGHVLPQRALALALILTAVAIVAAMLVVLLVPGLAIDACCSGTNWKLTLSHGEEFGVFAGEATLFFLVALLLGRLEPLLGLGLLWLALTTALLSHSASAKIALAAGLAMILSVLAGKRLRLGPMLVFPLVVLGVAGRRRAGAQSLGHGHQRDRPATRSDRAHAHVDGRDHADQGAPADRPWLPGHLRQSRPDLLSGHQVDPPLAPPAQHLPAHRGRDRPAGARAGRDLRPHDAVPGLRRLLDLVVGVRPVRDRLSPALPGGLHLGLVAARGLSVRMGRLRRLRDRARAPDPAPAKTPGHEGRGPAETRGPEGRGRCRTASQAVTGPEGISVVVPVLDGERHLAAALSSIAGQTLRPQEVIVVDDGSRDRSAAIAQAFPGVRYVAQNHSGQGAARNRGAELASGGLLAFLDADDLWVADKLERQLAALNAEPAIEAVFGLGRVVHRPRRVGRGSAAGGAAAADAVAPAGHDADPAGHV